MMSEDELILKLNKVKIQDEFKVVPEYIEKVTTAATLLLHNDNKDQLKIHDSKSLDSVNEIQSNKSSEYINEIQDNKSSDCINDFQDNKSSEYINEIQDNKSSDCINEIQDNKSFNCINEIQNNKSLDHTYKVKTTGLVYDEKMAEYFCSEATHVERPARVTSIFEKLIEDGLVERCHRIRSRNATEEEILLKHNKKHYNVIKGIEDKTVIELDLLANDYDSIYFHNALTQCSLLSAGCTIEIVEAVLKGKIKNGVAVVRPPGHHALENCSMGFCHFNNVALAAEVSITKYNLKKVLIVDWDVHYGNGIHKMFESDPRVLYFSLHRYDNNLFWPNSREANYDAVGTGDGIGYNFHVPWNKSKMGDSEYLCAFNHLLLPVIKEYQPELILVSAGFDSGLNDPLGRCCVTPKGYAHMTKKLMDFAKGNVVLVLEGGYNLQTISTSMSSCLSTLLGDPVPDINLIKPQPSAVLSISNTMLALKNYWKCLDNMDEMFISIQKEIHEERNSSSSSSEDDFCSDVINS